MPELEKVRGLCETMARVNPCPPEKTENNTESPWCVARLATQDEVSSSQTGIEKRLKRVYTF